MESLGSPKKISIIKECLKLYPDAKLSKYQEDQLDTENGVARNPRKLSGYNFFVTKYRENYKLHPTVFLHKVGEAWRKAGTSLQNAYNENAKAIREEHAEKLENQRQLEESANMERADEP